MAEKSVADLLSGSYTAGSTVQSQPVEIDDDINLFSLIIDRTVLTQADNVFDHLIEVSFDGGQRWYSAGGCMNNNGHPRKNILGKPLLFSTGICALPIFESASMLRKIRVEVFFHVDSAFSCDIDFVITGQPEVIPLENQGLMGVGRI